MVLKTDIGYLELKTPEAIKKEYNKLTEKYLNLRYEADKIKDMLQQLEELIEYEQ